MALSPRPDIRPWRALEGDGATFGAWQREIDGADVLVNLAGGSVNCRYLAAKDRKSYKEGLWSALSIVGKGLAVDGP